MDILQTMITIISHIVFIVMSHRLLRQLVDWEKTFKVNVDNLGQINLLVMFFSIALGYLVSNFFLTIISLGTDIFATIH